METGGLKIPSLLCSNSRIAQCLAIFAEVTCNQESVVCCFSLKLEMYPRTAYQPNGHTDRATDNTKHFARDDGESCSYGNYRHRLSVINQDGKLKLTLKYGVCYVVF